MQLSARQTFLAGTEDQVRVDFTLHATMSILHSDVEFRDDVIDVGIQAEWCKVVQGRCGGCSTALLGVIRAG